MTAEPCQHLPESHRPDCALCAPLMAATLSCPDCGSLSVWLHGAEAYANKHGQRFASLWWSVRNAVRELGGTHQRQPAVDEMAERIAWRVTRGYLLQLRASPSTRANVAARVACGVPFPARTDVWRQLRDAQQAEHQTACAALAALAASLSPESEDNALAPAASTSTRDATEPQQTSLFPMEET